MADTAPLLNMEGSPTPDDNFLTDVVFFHGKELRSGMGMRQSFIRKPGTEQVLVRIGIGRDGVFKVDGVENKVLEQWKFSDLKDCSFSGYSCTLQFRSSNRNYSVRTDDGEAICSYIEDFQKHPEQALKKARDNPPNSKVPESGVRTLRRKFAGTGDLKQSHSSEQVKFYTMNRRKKAPDPTSKIAHNVDVDKRLRAAYSHELLSHSGSDLGSSVIAPRGSKVNGIPLNGTKAGPTSTKGEATKNQATHRAKTSSPLQPSSPSVNRRSALEQQNSDPLLQTGSAGPSPPSKKKEGQAPVEPEDYFTLRQRSVSETMVKRGNSRPINVVKTVTMPWGSSSDKPTTNGQVKELKPQSAGGLGAGRRSSVPITSKEKHHSQDPAKAVLEKRSVSPSSGSEISADRAPLIHLNSSASNSSKGVSPDPELPYKQYEALLSRDGKAWYQSPESPVDEKPRPASPPYDTLSRSDSGMSSERLEFGAGIRSLKREDTSSSMEGFQFTVSPPGSPVYDHLPPSLPEKEGGQRTKAVSSSPPQSKKANTAPTLSAAADVPMRRNVSQPAMSGREEGGRGGTSWSSSSPGPDSIAEEEEEDDSDEEAGESALDHSGVVRRQKKNNSQQESDPFEDLLGTPQAVTRLRWSQELNPLYDYIRGMKITESISSQERGIKLYSANSADGKTVPGGGCGGGKKLKKLPSVIFEESETNPLSPKHSGTNITEVDVPSITEDKVEDDEGDTIPMIIPENKKLDPPPRRQHAYEEVSLGFCDTKSTSTAGLIAPPPIVKKSQESSATLGARGTGGGGGGGKSSLAALANPDVRRLQTLDVSQDGLGSSISPRLGKRQLQRRSRTVGCMDDTEAVTRKQKPLRAADTMKDFSFVMREFRLFYIKLPNGHIHSEIVSINRPVAELCEKLCDILGVDNVDRYLLYVEGACLTSLKEGELGEGGPSQRGVGRSNSLTHIMDHQWLPDQGSEPILLRSSLSLRMQGITTSRILALVCDDVVAEANNPYPTSMPPEHEAEEFHKHWISIVQGNTPCTPEQAVKLAAIQYQAYFLDRTAVHSVVGFCRPNEFLPTEFSTVRGLEQKMYKEQEKLKTIKTHKDVHKAYAKRISGLPTYSTIFFPVREPRKKVLQSTKLKPIVLGVGPYGIMRVDPKTKEVLDSWDYQVLRNWAYSRKTFVLAFTDKNYPVESNQAKWISMLVDFFVDSIINIARPPPVSTTI